MSQVNLLDSILGNKVTLLAELITSNLRCLEVKLVQTTYTDAPIGREERNLQSDSSYAWDMRPLLVSETAEMNHPLKHTA